MALELELLPWFVVLALEDFLELEDYDEVNSDQMSIKPQDSNKDLQCCEKTPLRWCLSSSFFS
jgi:hypothetical protein